MTLSADKFETLFARFPHLKNKQNCHGSIDRVKEVLQFLIYIVIIRYIQAEVVSH